MYVNMYNLYTYICIFVWMHISTHICTYVCIYTYVCVCIYIYIYLYLYSHIDAQIHIRPITRENICEAASGTKAESQRVRSVSVLMQLPWWGFSSQQFMIVHPTLIMDRPHNYNDKFN